MHKLPLRKNLLGRRRKAIILHLYYMSFRLVRSFQQLILYLVHIRNLYLCFLEHDNISDGITSQL